MTTYKYGNTFLTPDNPSGEETATKMFIVPANPVEIQSLIIGAFSLLYDERNFIQFGEMTEAEAAQYFRNLTIVTNLCEAIENNCLNDPGFIETIVDVLGDAGMCTDCGTDAPPENVGDTVLDDRSGSCSPANAYGMAFNTVEYIHETCRDFIEIIGAGFSIATLITRLMSVSPMFTIAAQASSTAISVFAAWFESVIEVYEASYDLTTQSQIACEIYCLIENDCILTLGDVRNAYSGILEIANFPEDGDFVDFLSWIVGVATSTDLLIVASYHMIVIEIWARLSSWLDSPQLVLAIAAQTALPISPPAECDCDDNEWCRDFDFSLGSQLSWGFTVSGRNQGTWTGDAFRLAWGVPSPNPDTLANGYRCYIRRAFDTGTANVGVVDIHTDGDVGGSNRNMNVSLWTNSGATLVSSSNITYSTTNPPHVESVDFGNQVGDTIQVSVSGDVGSDPSPDFYEITRIVMTGSNANPFTGGDNC